jgi:transcriptional regulator with XRE-family HTH domain
MNVMMNGLDTVGPIPIPPTTPLATGLGNPSGAASHAVSVALPPTRSPAPDRPLHRLGEIRQREGFTRRRIARMLGISIQEVEQQEQPSSDMLLSDLHRWEQALGVPAAELLDDPGCRLSSPVQLHARLIRVMKTVRSIQEMARQTSIRRLAEMLADQLIEVEPELKDTAAWPVLGQGLNERDPGQAYIRGLSLHCFDEVDRQEG